MEVLLRLEPAHSTYHEVRGGQPESMARFAFLESVAAEFDRIDGIEHHGHVRRLCTGPEQLDANVAGHRDDMGEPREDPAVSRVVDQALPGAVAGPAVRGGQRRHVEP